MKLLNVPLQADGSIEILDIFKKLSIGQLEFCLNNFNEHLIFEENALNLSLFEDILEIKHNKVLLKQTNMIQEMTPEFKKMVIGLLEKLIEYEKASQ